MTSGGLAGKSHFLTFEPHRAELSTHWGNAEDLMT
jgi:hypothetical protein